MKKKFPALCISLLLALVLCVPAFAEEKLDYVTDYAGLLSGEELQTLHQNAVQLAADYDFGVYIILLDDFTNYVDTYDVEAAAEALYLNNELGKRDDHSGLLLMLSMEDRDWAMYAFGYGNTAFTDYGKEYLSKQFLDDFKHDDWYSGLMDYQHTCGEMLESSIVEDAPIDVDHLPVPPHSRVYGIVACILLGFLIALLVLFILKSQLKSVAKGTQAEAFVSDGGLTLSERYDIYTHTTQIRVYDPPQKSSSSGGGTTTNSNGGSSASGHF